jgi:transposase-like protein
MERSSLGKDPREKNLIVSSTQQFNINFHQLLFSAYKMKYTQKFKLKVVSSYVRGDASIGKVSKNITFLSKVYQDG